MEKSLFGNARLSSLIVAAAVLSVGCGQKKNSSTVSDTAEIHRGTVSACADGDTCNIKLDDDGSTMKVRLIGIDAPESRGGDNNEGQPFGQEAKAYINDLIKGKSVKIRAISLDKYERTLGEIYLGNKLVNVDILRQGLAESYIWSDDTINADKYRDVEEKAYEAELGIWSLDEYESPEDFRRRMKEEEG